VRALEQQGAEATAWLEEGKEEAERDRVAQVLEEEADAVEKDEQVVSRGIDSLSRFIDRGIESGEFKPTPLRDYPQPLIAPVLTAIFWRQLFEWHHHLDTDALLRTNIELTDPIRAPGREPVESGKGEER
jgi:hypothetical protein